MTASQRSAQPSPTAGRTSTARRVHWTLSCAVWLLAVIALSAHDAERTVVTLTFARDGSFVLDVANDPNWLRTRMERFDANFADRVVLWVDGREVRPSAAEFLPPRREDALATWRLRGRVPIDARSLRWYYGLVADPYRLTIHRADGHIVGETVQGDAWSRAIDLTGQFAPPWRAALERQAPIVGMLALFAFALRARTRSVRRHSSPDRRVAAGATAAGRFRSSSG